MTRTMRLCTVPVRAVLLALLGAVGGPPAPSSPCGVVVVHSTGGRGVPHGLPLKGLCAAA